MKALRVLGLCVASLLLAACEHTGPASTAGECRIFVAPTQPVAGRTRADQFWIDTNIARGIGGCGWSRPRAAKK